MPMLTMAQALNTALRDSLAADDNVVVFGEDVGTLGGVFRVTDGLTRDFGDDRCFDTPLAESGIIGFAIGMAMAGFRPVVEMQFDAFCLSGVRADRLPCGEDPQPHQGRAVDSDSHSCSFCRRYRRGGASL